MTGFVTSRTPLLDGETGSAIVGLDSPFRLGDETRRLESNSHQPQFPQGFYSFLEFFSMNIMSYNVVFHCQEALNKVDPVGAFDWVTKIRRKIAEGNETEPIDVKVKLLCGADLLESFSVAGLWKDEDVNPPHSVSTRVLM